MISYQLIFISANGAGQLGSCEMFNAGDSGFSELTSLASSEDENLTNDLPSTRYHTNSYWKSFPVCLGSNLGSFVVCCLTVLLNCPVLKIPCAIWKRRMKTHPPVVTFQTSVAWVTSATTTGSPLQEPWLGFSSRWWWGPIPVPYWTNWYPIKLKFQITWMMSPCGRYNWFNTKKIIPTHYHLKSFKILTDHCQHREWTSTTWTPPPH